MTRVLIVEEYGIVRSGINAIIQKNIEGARVDETDCFEGALCALAEEKFDLVVMNIDIPGGNTYDMLSQIRLKQHEVPLLVFADCNEEIYGITYLRAGADGFLPKKASEEQFRQAVVSMINTGKFISSSLKNVIVSEALSSKKREPHVFTLSSRELEVSRLLTQGKGIKEIANILQLKGSTVSTFKGRIFEKLEVQNVIDLREKMNLLKIHG